MMVVELFPRLRRSPGVSRVSSTVKVPSRSTMASGKTVTLTHSMLVSDDLAVNVTGIDRAAKSPSATESEVSIVVIEYFVHFST